MKARDLKLHRSTSALMQSILLLVQRGARYWATGEVKPGRAERFVSKMHDRYGVLDTPMQKSRRKLEGRPSATLILHPSPNGSMLDWWLLSTTLLEDENLLDGWDVRSENRVRLLDKYALAQIPKPGQAPTWTWRLQKRYRADWEARMVDLCRGSQPANLNTALRALRLMPMCRGIRDDVAAIMRRGQSLWSTRAMAELDPKLVGAVRFSVKTELPIMRRVKAFADPPQTLGMWVDAYEKALLGVLDFDFELSGVSSDLKPLSVSTSRQPARPEQSHRAELSERRPAVDLEPIEPAVLSPLLPPLGGAEKPTV